MNEFPEAGEIGYFRHLITNHQITPLDIYEVISMIESDNGTAKAKSYQVHVRNLFTGYRSHFLSYKQWIILTPLEQVIYG